MRVVQAERFGGPEVLVARDVADPVAGPGQAVIAVSFADILFLDTQLRSGWGGEYFTIQPPYVPGVAVAGEVISAGDGVDHGWVGRRVVARTGEHGGYAERAVVPADGLTPVPDGPGLREAAALVNDGTTALGLFEGARIQPGEWVLVTAAAGGLGILLVQLAHTAGARVIGVARGKQKLDLTQELGADAVFDYSEPGWADRVRQATGGLGVDVVFDGVGGQIGRDALGATARGCRFSAHGTPSGDFAEIDPREVERLGVTVRGIEQAQFAPAEANRLTERVLSEAAAGRLRPVIGQTFPLERAADAHAAIEGRGVIGKTLLVI